MRRALEELSAKNWFAGLRRGQSQSRQTLPVLRKQRGCFKIHPLIDWSRRDNHAHLSCHALPRHPLREKSFQSVGDLHSSRPLKPGMDEQRSRLFGLVRECGLHC